MSEEESWGKLNSGKIAASVTTADVVAVYGRQFQVTVPAQIGYSRGADGLVVRNEIKKINDLEGKIVATGQFTEVDFFMRYLATLARPLLVHSETPVTMPMTSEAPMTSETPLAIDHAGLEDEVQRALRRAIATLLRMKADDVTLDAQLTDFGFDSISLVAFAHMLNETVRPRSDCPSVFRVLNGSPARGLSDRDASAAARARADQACASCRIVRRVQRFHRARATAGSPADRSSAARAP